MQFCLPIVATNWRGIPDVVHNNINGLLVNVRDVEALKNALLKLIKNEDLRYLMGNNGRKIYLDKFTSDKFYRKIEKCFMGLEYS